MRGRIVSQTVMMLRKIFFLVLLFLCAAVPDGVSALALRRHGVAVRDTDSFGLPGHWRINCAPQLDVLWRALAEVLSCAP